MLHKKVNRLVLIVTSVAPFLVGCTGVPDHVIQPDKMAALMADMNIAESAMDLGNQNFFTDSARQAVKQTVLMRHNVSQDLLDTSFMWYGAHLDKFMDVYDRSAEIIQKKIDENGALVAGQAALSVSGDSVDVWSSSRRILLSQLSSSNSVAFSYNSDSNWKKGDIYTWRAKFIGNSGEASWSFVAQYSDGATEVLNSNFNGTGWQELNFLTDSTRIIKNLYGILNVEPRNSVIYVDSVQMIRKRLDRNRYSQRYRQKLYEQTKKTQE